MVLPDPDGFMLLELERRCRQQGTGLDSIDLEGCWRLQQLWGRRDGRPLQGATALLRPLAASLTLTPDDSGLLVRNSVRLGALELRFEGAGELRGRRPLLVFWFNAAELRFGRRPLWRRALDRPPERSLPFFALIACRREGGEAWLAARGRGGGLAQWRLAPEAP